MRCLRKFAQLEDEVENVITDAEARKLVDLLNELPVLGRDDKFAGPRSGYSSRD